MIRPSWLLLLLFMGVPNAHSATRDNERPDRELLNMLDFLRDMEMVKQMDILRELHQVEVVGDFRSENTAQKSPPAKKKEGVR
jgi:hypothetical protein